MFTELVELGKRVHKEHDALCSEKCNWYIVIDQDGSYKKLIECDVTITAEKLPAKKGRARLLLDKAEETLCFEGTEKNDNEQVDEIEVGAGTKETEQEYKKKHERYMNKLNEYNGLEPLAPIFSFYSKHEEKTKALNAFKALPKNKQKGNMTFMVDSTCIASLECVTDAIKRKYDESLCSIGNKGQLCAICGSDKYPILDESHGSIKMPKGQTSGSMLVSYNTNAFESYNLKGNLNSGICTNCARNYVEALKFLVGNGHETLNEKGEKSFKYSNRQRISDDTIAVFWTKKPNEDIDPFSDICQPTEERMRKLFSSIATGDHSRADIDVDNYFYCCTISSAAARIAVRDWMAISVTQYQENLKQWFEDIKTIKDEKVFYPGINTIINNCIKKKSKPTQSDFKAKARIGSIFWHAALTNSSLPVMILQSVLDQIEHEKETKKQRIFSEEKSTVIRLILNRNIKNKYKMKEVLDEQNESKAYLCGRLFALVCKLQYKAQGAVNSSIKNRFFASASNMPGMVMGILLTKYVPIYEKKTKGAYTKSITDIAARIGHFPDKFTTIERGEFALGYYYQYSAKQNESNNE